MTMRNPLSKITIAAVILAGSMHSAKSAIIDTTVGWTGGGYFFAGDYGQVFTVPSGDSTLQSFSFFISGSDPNVSFQGQIVPWNPAAFESGSPLYTSEV